MMHDAEQLEWPILDDMVIYVYISYVYKNHNGNSLKFRSRHPRVQEQNKAGNMLH